MKEDAKQLAAYYKCTVQYSGKTKTMYVHGDEAQAAVGAIRNLIPFRKFKIEMA